MWQVHKKRKQFCQQSVKNDRLTFGQIGVYCIHKNKTSLRSFPELLRPGGRGLSGEHIQLCAEGARLDQPNLSGKWTENMRFLRRAVLCWAALFCFIEKLKEVFDYADQTH